MSSLAWVRLEVLERSVADVDVAEDVEAALLQRVHKVDQRARGPRVRHQQQHLREIDRQTGQTSSRKGAYNDITMTVSEMACIYWRSLSCYRAMSH